MTKESKTQISKSEPKRRSKRLENKTMKKTNNTTSSDEDTIYTSESEEELDVHEYRKLLQQLYPSKHLKNKIKSGEKIKEIIEEYYDSDSDSDSSYTEDYSSKKKKHQIRKNNILRKRKK